MSKPFKLRIYGAITTTLQSCRSKDPSYLPRDPIPSSHSRGRSQQDQRPTFNHQHTTTTSQQQQQQQYYTFQTQPKYHVITAPQQPCPQPKQRRRRTKKRSSSNHHLPPRVPALISSSSAESTWPHLFSSEDDDECTEALVSSTTTTTTDEVSSSRVPPRRRRRRRKVKSRVDGGGCGGGDERVAAETVPARLSVFQKLIPCTVDGKVKESVAVVKRSSDPYEDFKRSMMDMVLEKNMFDERDLEQLLQCFLSLNSTRYHGMIVQAFYDIWEAVFDV